MAIEAWRPSTSLVSNRISGRDRTMTLSHGKTLGERNTYRLLAIIEFQVIRPLRVSTVVQVLAPLRNDAARQDIISSTA